MLFDVHGINMDQLILIWLFMSALHRHEHATNVKCGIAAQSCFPDIISCVCGLRQQFRSYSGRKYVNAEAKVPE